MFEECWVFIEQEVSNDKQLNNYQQEAMLQNSLYRI